MNWRALPPLSSLRAFAAFAQTGNVVAAGEALGVSHAAISQQLRALEAHLDLKLLDRTGRAMELTRAGERLSLALDAGFARMIDAVVELTGAADARPLQITTTPTFAAFWLMPRLPGFRAEHPKVDLMLNPTPAVVSLTKEGVDVAIRHGSGDWAGLEAEPLLRSPMVVVAAPSLVGSGALPTFEALADYAWLEEFGTTEAGNWLQRHGVSDGARTGSMQLPGNLMLDAVRDGQGVAVTVRAFVERDIEAGRLREIHTEDAPDRGYYIVTRPGVARPALRDFLRWLRREGKRDDATCRSQT